ncbi:MAG: threonine synthase [Alphaproteobacteria bacterium]|nr:threonine synthase [Alphaproteobacteria bacterium]
MKYISTRGNGEPQSFETVLLAGMAPDGGLYVPESWPSIDIASLKGKSYCDVAFSVMYPFVEGSIPAEDFKKIVEETYADSTFRHKDVVPLHHLEGYGNGNVYVMELFHGPTIAFKDIALQLLGRLFDYVLKQREERITIVGATSGDTGSAAIEGCKFCQQADIFILHPQGRVSDVQRKQMTTVNAPNVYNVALDGSFDDCQNLVKAMFADETFRKSVNLSAVNSINWARIMAQIVYYYTSALALGAPEKEISFVVPTGNFGNVFAAYSAKQMGLPIKTLNIASNENDILTRFFEEGIMRIDEAYKTLSPSMDIQIPSNFERYLFDLFDRNTVRLDAVMRSFKDCGNFTVSDEHLQKACSVFTASRADDDATLELIKNVYEIADYILDPHTAVGMKAVKAITEKLDSDDPVVLLATAHPAKFPDAVENAIGVRPALPGHLADLFEREEVLIQQPNDLLTVMAYVKANSQAIT